MIYLKTKEERQKLSHLKNLVGVAIADGKLEKIELAAIDAICNREGIDFNDVERCIKNPKGIKFIPPEDDDTKLQYLKDMVALMMCDGDLAPKEMLTCKLCAEALGFRHEVIDALIIQIVKELSELMKENKN